MTREEKKKYNREYWKRHKEEIILKKKKYFHEYYLNNSRKLCEKARIWSLKNKEKIIQRKNSPKGVIQHILHGQKTSSKKRNHPMPPWTFDELYTFAMYEDKFCELYFKWEMSGFNPYLKPSIDRIDPELPYTWNNIVFMTVYENKFIKGPIDSWKIRRLKASAS